MGKNIHIQSFEMEKAVLSYDLEKSVLSCQSKINSRKLWVKKLYDLNLIAAIIEDSKRYYLACDSGEINGQFLAVRKETGVTDWFIPGRSFLHVIFKGHIYLIFADESSRFYFLKVNLNNGKAAWHHPVDPDLNEYSFGDNKIKLHYLSGKVESLSISTGKENPQPPL